jgi:hypothetical protein
MTRARTLAIIGLSLTLLTFLFAALFLAHKKQYPNLPYKDSFAEQKTEEWVPYGGAWRLKGEEMVNRSDEPEAILITGAPQWRDYQVDVDMRLRSLNGEIGVVLRVNNPEIGIDSFRGYYAGIRSFDEAIVTSRSDYNDLESRPINLVDGVQVGTWYHMHVVVVSCELAAAVTNLATGATTYAAMRDTPGDCITSGQAGLRSTTSGAWRSFRVTRATIDDLHSIQSRAASIEQPEYPIREDDYSRMHSKYFPRNSFPRVEVPIESLMKGASVPLVTVESLRSGANFDSEVRLRGVATFAEPVYLQDATGGVMLETSNSQSVNIGDELQVIGHLVSGGFSPVFAVSSVQMLREKPPIVPLSVTSTEAASGQEAGSLVEVTGVVEKGTRSADGGLVLEMADSAQKYSVELKNLLFGSAMRDWSPGTTLRVRGICTIGPEATSDNSFTILVGSPSDVVLVSGPRWWSGWRLVRTIVLGLLVVVIGIYVYLRFKRSTHEAILRERERLAHAMHDTLAQSFAGVGYYLQSIRRSLRKAPEVPKNVLEELDVACEMVTETHREASATIAAMHPAAHGNEDLLTALHRSTSTMLGGDRLPVTLTREGHVRELPPALTEGLYRIGCESISNVLRHAHATALKLGIHYESKQVTLIIEDDGKGFVHSPAAEGFGLQGMRKRCLDIGAELLVQTESGKGCIVRIAAPYRWPGSLSEWLRTHLKRI